MEDFLKFVDDLKRRFPIHIEITYSKITDWTIIVYQKGRADDYPGIPRNGSDAIFALEQNIDMELCFAKAHVTLKERLTKFNDGY